MMKVTPSYNVYTNIIQWVASFPGFYLCMKSRGRNLDVGKPGYETSDGHTM